MADGENDTAGRPAGLIGDVPASVLGLVGLFAVVYFATALMPAETKALIDDRLGLYPARLALGARGPDGWAGAIYPLFSHGLIHANATHLFFNLIWLLVFGTPIARRFRSILRFNLFFWLCTAAGGLLFSLAHLRDATLLVGASGGITGLLGGLVRFAFHRPYSKQASAKGVLPLTDKSVLTWAAVVIAMNASIAFFGAGFGAGDANIAWEAHVGGFLFGLVAFPLFDPRRR